VPSSRHRGILPPRVERVAQAQFEPFVAARALAIIKIGFGAQPTFSTPLLQYFGAEHGDRIRFGYVDRARIAAYAMWSQKHLGGAFRKGPTRSTAAPDGYYLLRGTRSIAFHPGARSDPARSLTTMGIGAVVGALVSSTPWSSALKALEQQEAEGVIPVFEAALREPPPDQEAQSAPSSEPSSEPFSPFNVLRIPETASDEEVKAAYRKHQRLNHPDLTAHLSTEIQQLAGQQSLAINTAYKTIMDGRAKK
jgi:hypothetical protein